LSYGFTGRCTYDRRSLLWKTFIGEFAVLRRRERKRERKEKGKKEKGKEWTTSC
jgi:hypothetical protein